MGRRATLRLSIFSAILLMLLAACSATGEPSGGAVKGRDCDQTEGHTELPPPDGPSQANLIDRINLEGSGATLTDEVRLERGPFVVAFTHNGSSRFAVTLGPLVLIRTTGPYEGTRYFEVGAGDYAFDVDTDGDWTLRVTQPHYDGGYALPHTFRGRGDTVMKPFEITESRRVRVKFTYSGSRKFEIYSYDSDGNPTGFNTVNSGPPAGTSGALIDPCVEAGVQFLTVITEGTWSIKVS